VIRAIVPFAAHGVARAACRGALFLALAVATTGFAGAEAPERFGWRTAVPEKAGSALGGLAIDVELVVGGIADPVDITHAGDGSGRLFVAEQEGFIRIVQSGQVRPVPFLDIESLVLCCGERGLLGLAFDPDYATNGFFYVNYTDNAGDSVVARYDVSAGNPNRADPNSGTVLKTWSQPFSNHNGGDLAFGPDGHLYVASGDGGSSSDPDDNGQTLDTLLGKILRLDVDAPPDYIPVDNPFVGDPMALDEIWSYGVRNPWRFGFDRLTGDLFVADVGQFTKEEVSFQAASSSGGENWGWRVLEGTFCHRDDPPGACDDFLNGGSELPILEYGHTGGNCAITGGYRYRGAAYPDLDGVYFYADFCSGRIWGATEDAPGIWLTEELLDTAFLISTFGEDEAGELYFAHLSGSGEIYRIVSTAGGGGIPCEDVRQLQARCLSGASNRIQARVVMTDTSHSGESVTIGIDGAPNVVPIVGNKAQIQQNGASSGLHVISLDDPDGCVADFEVTCP
jgi:glucose/arabinose dehydrogenase